MSNGHAVQVTQTFLTFHCSGVAKCQQVHRWHLMPLTHTAHSQLTQHNLMTQNHPQCHSLLTLYTVAACADDVAF